jgi:hypothetical protein
MRLAAFPEARASAVHTHDKTQHDIGIVEYEIVQIEEVRYSILFMSSYSRVCLLTEQGHVYMLERSRFSYMSNMLKYLLMFSETRCTI